MPALYFSFSGLAVASDELHSTSCFCLLLAERISLLFTDHTTDSKIDLGIFVFFLRVNTHSFGISKRFFAIV